MRQPRHGLAAPQVREANRALVLNMLRGRTRLSRAEIARRSGLSEGAVSRIVAGLMVDRLVTESGAGTSTGGRPGTGLELDHTELLSIGVDVQNWETHVTAGDIEGRLLTSESFRTPASPCAAIHAVAEVALRIRQRFPERRLEGAGVALRGIIDTEAGVVELGNLPGWRNVPVRQELEAALETPVHTENNVRAAALAEYAQDERELSQGRCLLFVMVDDGIGMGIVLNGALYRGSHMAAGEIGQMVTRDSPGRGREDRAGCLELQASNPAICRRYSRSRREPGAAPGGEAASRVREICARAMQGEREACEALRQACRFLGIGIANAVWTLDADLVVLNGPLTEAWPIVVAAVTEQFPEGPEYPNFRRLAIRPSLLGSDAAAAGARMLPFARLFTTGKAFAAEAG